jgi:hypothetical protein
MGGLEVIPHRWEGRAEIAEQIGEHLPHRLRLARELRQIVPVMIVTVAAPVRTTRSSPTQRLGTE